MPIYRFEKQHCMSFEVEAESAEAARRKVIEYPEDYSLDDGDYCLSDGVEVGE